MTESVDEGDEGTETEGLLRLEDMPCEEVVAKLTLPAKPSIPETVRPVVQVDPAFAAIE